MLGIGHLQRHELEHLCPYRVAVGHSQVAYGVTAWAEGKYAKLVSCSQPASAAGKPQAWRPHHSTVPAVLPEATHRGCT